MKEMPWINGAFAIYFSSSVAYGLNLFFQRRLLSYGATALLTLGVILNTVAIFNRWVEAQRPPFSNMYESLLCFAWSIALVYLVLEFLYKIKVVGFLAALLAVGALALMSLFDPTIEPLVPALQSNWLTYHVLTCFIGYAAFGVSFAVSLVYLFLHFSRKPSEVLIPFGYQAIKFGFLFLTVGIITGAVWANESWGSYWSWDPKETWSFITWLIYALGLHFRYVANWLGVKDLPFSQALFSVFGFISVIFTYFGVNFILSGLHSYA